MCAAAASAVGDAQAAKWQQEGGGLPSGTPITGMSSIVVGAEANAASGGVATRRAVHFAEDKFTMSDDKKAEPVIKPASFSFGYV